MRRAARAASLFCAALALSGCATAPSAEQVQSDVQTATQIAGGVLSVAAQAAVIYAQIEAAQKH